MQPLNNRQDHTPEKVIWQEEVIFDCKISNKGPRLYKATDPRVTAWRPGAALLSLQVKESVGAPGKRISVMKQG